MPRIKAAKADNLTNARSALTKAMTAYGDAHAALDLALSAKDFSKSQTAFKTAHGLCLETKDLLKILYRHITELRPKAEPKPAKEPKETSAERKAARKSKAEPEMTEADPDAP